jgi:hypothetical protein
MNIRNLLIAATGLATLSRFRRRLPPPVALIAEAVLTALAHSALQTRPPRKQAQPPDDFHS